VPPRRGPVDPRGGEVAQFLVLKRDMYNSILSAMTDHNTSRENVLANLLDLFPPGVGNAEAGEGRGPPAEKSHATPRKERSTPRPEESPTPPADEQHAAPPPGERRRPQRKKRRRPDAAQITPHREARPDLGKAPYWLPAGDLWDRLPAAMRQAVVDILAPAYQRLVLQVADDLERSTGITLVHLMWLEISDQLRLAETVAERESFVAAVGDERPEEMIAEHLHLVAAKNATSELLVKLRMVRQMAERGAWPAGALPGAAIPDERFGRSALAQQNLRDWEESNG
jgi:hypothetical protein